MAQAQRSKRTEGKAGDIAPLDDVIERLKAQPDVVTALSVITAETGGIADIAGAIQVRNNTEKLVAADMLRRVKTAQTLITEQFEEPCSAAHKTHKAITGLRGKCLAPFEAAEQTLKGRIEEYELKARRELEAYERAQAPATHINPYNVRVVGFGQAGSTVFAYGPPVSPFTSDGNIPGPVGPAWSNPMAPAMTPVQAQGVSTRVRYAVNINAQDPAIVTAVVDGLGRLGVQMGFIVLDVAAMQRAVNGPEQGETWRALLASIPGIEVTEEIQITARGY